MSTIKEVSPMKSVDRTFQSAESATVTEQFKDAFRNHAAGVAVITADSGEGPTALTVTSVISVSAEPPILAFSLSAFSGSAQSIKAANSLVVHLLQAGQMDIAQLCAQRGADRFGDTSKWGRLASGEPVFLAAPVWIRGMIIDQMEIAGSTVVAVQAVEIGTVEDAGRSDSARPLIYHDRCWHSLCEVTKLQA
ncbi:MULTISPECIES: flavin reductase family protein [unclassified Pseudomonas]|uniref:flavin reductase family protein n=1 Tax=unclassified Pseudomonas TaxID=196821 RepID=UPI001A92696F|nr:MULTISPECIES: flavin reductase family protein [unclassified Pseudomonas]